MSLVLLPVDAGRAALFESVPARLHRSDPWWTPVLPGDERRRFDPRANPSLAGTALARWVAMDGKTPVGRVAAFAPREPADAGYFGFFESPDDAAIAGALLDRAAGWLAERGRSRMLGPIAVLPRDEIGLVVDGFDRPGTVLTPCHPPYYRGLLEAHGFRPAVRLRSYAWTPAVSDPGGVIGLDNRISTRGRLRVRPLDAARLESEAQLAAQMINTAFRGVWGFTPISPAEAAAEARDLRVILDPALCFFAQDADGPVGVALTVPDANWLLRRMGGRLLPFGWIRLLRWRRRIPWARFMALAVLPGGRAGGAALRLVLETHYALVRRGYTYAELAQVFDDNWSVRRVIERLGCPVARRFAVYERGATLDPVA